MTVGSADQLTGFIRDIPDYPKTGILFKDITPLLSDPKAFNTAVALMAEPFNGKSIDKVVSVEARGFIFGSAISAYLKAGFVPVRKKGKLPYLTYEQTYQLEYGEDCLQVHQDSILPGQNILIVDDLLATGGTLGAVADLISRFDVNVVGIACLIELDFLNGRSKLPKHLIHTVLHY